MTASALYIGHVAHRRVRPRAHALRYRLFSLLLDLDEIDRLAARLRLFSRNRFNLFSFHDRDHAGGTAEPLRVQIERHLRAAGLPTGGAIRLLTMPRMLGFAFNPLSVYFCHARNGRLAAILYEVNNTFGERHSYLLPADAGADGTIRHGCAKTFHVSPFMAMDMTYAFRVAPPGERLGIAITGADRDGTIITAVLSSRREDLTDAALARAFLTHPLLTAKVVAGILWEALKLWGKGVRIHAHPAPPAHPVTAYPAIAPVVALPEAACI
jgi:DUF1365 family protein